MYGQIAGNQQGDRPNVSIHRAMLDGGYSDADVPIRHPHRETQGMQEMDEGIGGSPG